MLALLLVLLVAACTKADDDTPTTPLDELPLATQVGANTFGCLIDGVPFVNGGGGNALQDVIAQYQSTPFEDLSVVGKNIVSTPSDLTVESVIFRTISIEVDDTQPSFQSNSYRIKNNGTENRYFIDSTKHYSYEITYHNPTTNIVAGTFENYSYCPITGDTIHITDGRFDVIYFE